MKKLNPFFLVGLLGIFTAGSQFVASFYAAQWGDQNIHWTHAKMALPLRETADVFELQISGESVQSHLDRGSLRVKDASGAERVLVYQDFKARVNHWPSRQASLFKAAVFMALLVGMALAFLGLGLWKMRAEKKSVLKTEEGAASDV